VVLACYDGPGSMTLTPLEEISMENDVNALMGEEDEASRTILYCRPGRF